LWKKLALLVKLIQFYSFASLRFHFFEKAPKINRAEFIKIMALPGIPAPSNPAEASPLTQIHGAARRARRTPLILQAPGNKSAFIRVHLRFHFFEDAPKINRAKFIKTKALHGISAPSIPADASPPHANTRRHRTSVAPRMEMATILRDDYI
jgi:hypothetical protein